MTRRALGWGLALLIASASFAASPPPFHAENGVVVSAHPGASQAGVELLQAGGDAVDAAVAVMSALTAATPGSSGLGGGFFALVYRADEGKTYVLDAREIAPAAAHRDMYLVKGRARPG